VILDRGMDQDRISADAILQTLAAGGLRIRAADEDAVDDPDFATGEPDVITWTGGLGTFSAWIAASDLYVGYDSAFQHVAAALGTPVIAVVLGSPGPTFRHRWKPYSRGPVRILGHDGLNTPRDRGQLTENVLARARELLTP